MSCSERDWVILQDELCDAHTIISDSSSDTSYLLNIEDLRPSITTSTNNSAPLKSERSDQVESLEEEVVRLREENALLVFELARIHGGTGVLDAVVDCMFEWIFQSLNLLVCPGESLSSPTDFLFPEWSSAWSQPSHAQQWHVYSCYVTILPNFSRIASTRLKAGACVGSMYVPDLDVIRMRKGSEKISAWVQSL